MVKGLEADKDGRPHVSGAVIKIECSRKGLELMAVDIAEITQRLRELPEEKLAVVYEFVNRLAKDREMSEGFKTMLASEAVLRRDWDRPEEDAAWADL